MLFNTDDLDTEYKSKNTLSLLESMYRIDRIWSKYTPASVPLLENLNYGGAYMVKYSDLLKLSHEYDASIQECIDAVTYTNNLRPTEVIVSLEEWRPYVDKDILYRFTNNYVLVPEINTPAYKLCEMCMESFLETGDYSWLDFYVECPKSILNEIAPRWIEGNNKYDPETRKVISDPGHWDFTNVSDDELKAWMKSKAKEHKAAKDYGRNYNWDTGSNRHVQGKIDTMATSRKAWDDAAAEVKRRRQSKSEENKEQADQSNNSQTQQDNGPSWLSQKWTALKNWWNNAGQADDNGKVGWFSNLVSQFKSSLGLTNNPAQVTNNTTQTTTDSKETPAKPEQTNPTSAQPAEQKPPEQKAAEDKAAKQQQNAVEVAKIQGKQEGIKAAQNNPPKPVTSSPTADANKKA